MDECSAGIGHKMSINVQTYLLYFVEVCPTLFQMLPTSNSEEFSQNSSVSYIATSRIVKSENETKHQVN